MKVCLTFKDYITHLREYSNFPLDISLLVKPFGIIDDGPKSDCLLVGHLLDAMSEEFDLDDLIDPLDAASVALSLGYESADAFLERGPLILCQGMSGTQQI